MEAPRLFQVSAGIERLKFLSPTHDSDVDDNGYGDLIFQNGADGANGA